MELANNVVDAYPNGDSILEDAKVPRMDMEERLIQNLAYALENVEYVDRQQKELRALLETIVILNTAILENPEFEHLFNRHLPILRVLMEE